MAPLCMAAPSAADLELLQDLVQAQYRFILATQYAAELGLRTSNTMYQRRCLAAQSGQALPVRERTDTIKKHVSKNGQQRLRRGI